MNENQEIKPGEEFIEKERVRIREEKRKVEVEIKELEGNLENVLMKAEDGLTGRALTLAESIEENIGILKKRLKELEEKLVELEKGITKEDDVPPKEKERTSKRFEPEK